MFREYDPRKRKWRDIVTGSYYDEQFGGFPIPLSQIDSTDYSVVDNTPAPAHTTHHAPDVHTSYHHTDTSSSFDFGHHSF